MIEGMETIGTLGKSGHVVLEFAIMQAQVTEKGQTTVLDFKRTDFSKD